MLIINIIVFTCVLPHEWDFAPHDLVKKPGIAWDFSWESRFLAESLWIHLGYDLLG